VLFGDLMNERLQPPRRQFARWQEPQHDSKEDAYRDDSRNS
jgi:hypothetical protein